MILGLVKNYVLPVTQLAKDVQEQQIVIVLNVMKQEILMVEAVIAWKEHMTILIHANLATTPAKLVPEQLIHNAPDVTQISTGPILIGVGHHQVHVYVEMDFMKYLALPHVSLATILVQNALQQNVLNVPLLLKQHF